MRRAVELARRFATRDLPVLLVGETGTGKEVLAQAIHVWSGRSGLLVDVDCGALPEGMFVNELFGHRRGAYTSAVDHSPGLLLQADRGTLFLDELASLPAQGQAALIRVLETREVRALGGGTKREVDFRLVAAIQGEPAEAVERKLLRRDLFERLAGGVIRLAPLRERPEDLLPLAHGFALELGRRIPAAAGEGVLPRYSWPGNVRELRQVIRRAASLVDTIALDAGALAEAVGMGAPTRMGTACPTAIDDRDRALLLSLGEEHEWRVEVMAAALGVVRSTLYRRMRRLGIGVANRRIKSLL